MGGLHHRKSIRLAGYDYSLPGYYLVGMATNNRRNFFGYLADSKMILNKTGYLASKYIKEIPRHFPNTKIDAFKILPDHIHVIILIKGPNVRWGAPWRAPTNGTNGTERKFGPLIPKTLSSIINSFKSTVTRKIKKSKTLPGEKIWQVNYFERIIRNNSELWGFRWYIQENSARHWLKNAIIKQPTEIMP